MPWYWEGQNIVPLEILFVKKWSKNINANIYDITQFYNEYDIKPNTGNYSYHFPLPHKIYLELQDKYSINYNQSVELLVLVTVVVRNKGGRRWQNIYKYKNTILLDGQILKLTGVNNVEIGSTVVKDETSDNK